MPTDYCFPFRHEELKMLAAAAELCPSDANTWYYLGDLCYYYEQREGIAGLGKGCGAQSRAWAGAAQPRFRLRPHPREARAGRNAVRGGDQGRRAERGARAGAGQAVRKTGARQRVARPSASLGELSSDDPTVLRWLGLEATRSGQFDVRLADSTTRRSHVWEGAEALRQPFVDACLLRGLARLAAGRNVGGLARFFRCCR